jgi:CRISPR system Cascade subunit CasA
LDQGREFNLISAAWLPVVHSSGRRDRVRPADLTDGIDADPILDVNWPRADFRCATLEFLIGLLTVACPPRDNDDWQARWARPPSKAELEAAFAPLEATFSFDGDGPRAYQDYEDFATEPTRVETLLIEAPGAATVEKNIAFLVKAGRVLVLSRPGAAMALLTLQTMASSGGRGYSPSLRGGGPLTTLVLSSTRPTLWHRLWANVPAAEALPPLTDLPRMFPWLAPTRQSNAGRTTTPEDVDWRQAFFGMPRRIRLDFAPNVDSVPCDLTGEIDQVVVRSYRILPQGTKYDAWGGRHPLTPHYKPKASDPVLLPVHGQAGRIGYRQWAAMLYGDKAGLRMPASCVSLFLKERKDDLPPNERAYRLLAAGYAMVPGQAKALTFMEAETPDITVPVGDGVAVAAMARDFVAAANDVAVALGHAMKMALYGDRADVSRDSTPLVTARDRFWTDTNDSFFDRLNKFSSRPSEQLAGEAAMLLGKDWRIVLERAALAIFDDMAPVLDALSPNVKRVVEGRRFLVRTLLGYGGRGVELFKNLQLPAPEMKTPKGKAA